MSEKVKLDIRYHSPTTKSKVFSFLTDIIIFALIFLSVVMVGITIFQGMDSYTENQNIIATSEVASGLYVEVDGENVLYSDYLDDNDSLTNNEKITLLMDVIETYVQENDIQEYFYELMEDEDLTEGLFTYDSVREIYIFDTSSGALPIDAYEVLVDIFTTYIISYYRSNSDYYYSTLNLFYGYLVVFIIAIVIAHFVTYGLFSFIFRRSRSTLGNKIFRFGYINHDGLAIKRWKFTLIYIFKLLVMCFLSLVSFMIPHIISWIMIAVRKDNRNLTEYIFNIHKVDIEKSKIYTTISEYIGDYNVERSDNLLDSFKEMNIDDTIKN